MQQVTRDSGGRRSPLLPGSGSSLRLAVFGIAAAVLVLVTVLIASAGGWVARPAQRGTVVPPTTRRTTPSAPRRSVEPQEVTQQPSTAVAMWVWIVLVALLALVIVLVLHRLLDGRRRDGLRRRTGARPEPQAVPDLDDEGPPPVPAQAVGREFDARAAADAVVSCWVWVEQWAADRGTERLAAETPTEFLDRVVGLPGAADRSDETVVAQQDPERSAAARVLLPLYQRARFDVAALDEESALRARDAALTVCAARPRVQQ